MAKLNMRRVSMVTLLSAVGCGGASVGTGNEVTETTDASPPTAPTPTVSVRGVAHAADGSTLPGVQVCLDNGIVVVSPPTNPGDCTVSASDGSFGMSAVSHNKALTLTFQKDGFEPTVRPIELRVEGDVTLPSSENVLFANPLVFMGTPADPNKGQIAFAVSTTGDGPTPQVSATAVGYFAPNGVAGVPESAVYADEHGTPAPGVSVGTSGGFVNVASGLYLIQFHPTSGYCASTSGLYSYAATVESNGDVALLVPVIRGYVTTPVDIWCTSDGP